MNPGFTLRTLRTSQLVEELSRRKGITVKSAGRGQTIKLPANTTVILIEQEVTP